MGQYISLKGADSIPVLVTVDGAQRIGELEAWRQNEAGDWEGFCRYAGPDPRGFTGIFLGWFPADDIMPDEQPDDDPATAGDASPPEAPQP